ncbi:mucin-22-like isoform X3 [Crassostrea angulata]|uniref:mucin-22-like isoform X3 n=1 Tax=Magallana angulata TaxID=2784310 RepID=UPI0022B10F95|nr:mucin-22-like isoform X3 [Crassostrea angulata]
MEQNTFTALILFSVFFGGSIAQTVPVTTYVTTPKVVEAKLGEEARFYLTYTTPDNSSEFTVSRLGANGTEEILRVVDLTVTTNANWTMAANVQTGAVDGDTRRVNVTIYRTDFVTHEGDYVAMVTGSDGAAQDLFTIRTLASPEQLSLSVSSRDVSEGTPIQFTCSGNTGRPEPVVHLLQRETYNGANQNATFHRVLSDTSSSGSFLENGTFSLSHNFTWTPTWQDNLVEFRCDISYNIGLGTALSSAQSNQITLNVTSTKIIQIETKPQIVRYKEEDLVVVCTLNKPETLQNLFFLQLKRRSPSGTLNNVVSVTGATIQWQDQTLQNRANVTGTVASPPTAHLSMVIRKDSVQCPLDFTEYECSLSGFGTGATGAFSEITYPVKVSYTVQPMLIETPKVREAGSGVDTSQREFRNGTVIELTCTGQIGSDQNATIRWCAKTAGAPTFTGLSNAAVHSMTTSGPNCQNIRSSTVTYNITSSDIRTEILCESGYSSQCNSGTAKQFVTISLDLTKDLPSSTTSTTPEVTTPSTTTSTTTRKVVTQGQNTAESNTGLIVGAVVGGVVVLIVIILVLVYFLILRRKSAGESYNTTKASSKSSSGGSTNNQIPEIKIQPRKKTNKEVKDTEGYDNEALDEERAAGTQNGARESMGLSNGHSNGVADEHVNVRM